MLGLIPFYITISPEKRYRTLFHKYIIRVRVSGNLFFPQTFKTQKLKCLHFMVSVVIFYFILIHKHTHVYILVNWWSQYRGSIGRTIYKTTPFKEQFNIKYGSSNRNCLFERCKYKEIDNSKSSGSDWKVYSLDTGLLCIQLHVQNCSTSVCIN